MDDHHILFKKDNYRVCLISRFNSNGEFEHVSIKEGLAIQRQCDCDEGEDDPHYYVLAFIEWNARRHECDADALLDRIADAWDENPREGKLFKEAYDYACAKVYKANTNEGGDN